jgi:hypothetical protein
LRAANRRISDASMNFASMASLFEDLDWEWLKECTQSRVFEANENDEN